jgi:hypothetical protein
MVFEDINMKYQLNDRAYGIMKRMFAPVFEKLTLQKTGLTRYKSDNDYPFVGIM